ncbi:hypothetical protein [Reyranella sp. CPCC 100927]|uniref:hypothetical protein n=1 Tax=Reyranella sp. CPCC 100927 TaxID=2599616 RepID=UPI0011B524AB|nr:hypothetical protein [Reyranella sp. CPCC 100927]TWT15268.1 hypothetical protein FQU96_02590 [Reyranella sp. CPCC 100927]
MSVESNAGGYVYGPMRDFASSGVKTLPGFGIEYAVLSKPLPLADGFAVARRTIEGLGRPLAAFCGFELRMPTVLDRDGFLAFNKIYASHLDSWGLLRDGLAMTMRTNVVPTTGAPAEISLAAFSYTVPTSDPSPSFVMSGAPEIPMGAAAPVRRGETSDDALLEKTQCVVDTLLARAQPLGIGWDDATQVHLYARHALALMVDRQVLAPRGIRPLNGIICYDTAAPMVDLELEIDIRRCLRQYVAAA